MVVREAMVGPQVPWGGQVIRRALTLLWENLDLFVAVLIVLSVLVWLIVKDKSP